jgi:hypothetical protein
MDSQRMNRFIGAALKKWRPIAIVLGVSAAVVVLGCGGDNSGLARRYKVTGNVTYKGAPIAKGNINFEPTKPPVPEGRHASGAIKDGYYSLSTAGDGEDGALPGEYKVVILATDIDMAALSAKTGGQRHQGDREDQKAVKSTKSLVPVKYSRSETSRLTATVKETSNHRDFELTD